MVDFLDSANLVTMLVVIASSFAAAVLLTRSSSWHLRWSARGHGRNAVQSIHHEPTPRIGGVAIFVGLVVGITLLPRSEDGLAEMLLVSAIPIFIIGLIEDIGNNVTPRMRLLAAFFSGLVFFALSGFWLPRVDLPGVDWMLGFAPLAILFTLFASGGVAHAFNLIDGLNGLAGFTAVFVSLALAAIGWTVGDTLMITLPLLIAAATLGFLLLNYPAGKIFLGDAGAYTLGHLLSWASILLIIRNPEVSPWAVLLIFFWPVMEVLYSIFRRRVKRVAADQPDRMHYHHLVFRSVRAAARDQKARHRANPVATLLVLPIVALPALLSLYTWDGAVRSGISVFVMAAVYVVLYRALVARFRARSASLAMI